MALLIKKSLIPNAGKGLFTTKPIKKEGKVIEYRGEIIGFKEYRKRSRKHQDHYIFYLRRDLCIDALYTKQYKARYANDARGFSRVKGFTNNCDYVIEGDKCFIVANKPIKAGDEILVNYTAAYWKSMRLRLRPRGKKR